jgi:hypothetical protein
MLSTLIAKIGLPVLVQVVAGALGRIDNPAARTAKDALEDVEKALDKGLISGEQLVEAHRHTEEMLRMKIEESSATISEINKSLRKEINSQDKFVRRMRPTFGYLMALTWAAQMFGLAYVIIFQTEKAPYVLNAMASLGAIWGVGLSVLGIYVYKRSEDKKLYDSADEEAIYWAGSRK